MSSSSHKSHQSSYLFQDKIQQIPPWLGQEGHESATKTWLCRQEFLFSQTSHLEKEVDWQHPTRCVRGVTNLPSRLSTSISISNTFEQLAMQDFPEQNMQVTIDIRTEKQSKMCYSSICQPFYPKEAKPACPPSSAKWQPTRRASAGVGRSQSEEITLSEHEQYSSLSTTQRLKEYDELFQGPISNEEFLERLRIHDEHWDTKQFNAAAGQKAVKTPVQSWYEDYMADNPEKGRPLASCKTDEEREMALLAIQDDYDDHERQFNTIVEDCLKTNVRPGADPVQDAHTARVFQRLVKGKYPENDKSGRTQILDREVLKSGRREFARMLFWYYKMMTGYFEGRFQRSILNELSRFLDLQDQTEGEDLEQRL